MTRRERRTKIAEAIRLGESRLAISQRFGITVSMVDYVRKEFGLAPDWKPLTMPPSTYEIIADLVNTDQKLCVLAEKYRLTAQRISKIYRECVRAGIPVTSRKSH